MNGRNIGKSNVSSLNADMTPRRGNPALGSSGPMEVDDPKGPGAVKPIKDYVIPGSVVREDTEPPKRGAHQAPRTPPSPAPAPQMFMQQQQQQQMQQMHNQGSHMPAPNLGAPPPSFQTLHGMESPLLSSLEEQRRLALSLLPALTGGAPPYQHTFSPQSVYSQPTPFMSPQQQQYMNMTAPSQVQGANHHMLHPSSHSPATGQWSSQYHGGMAAHAQTQGSMPFNSMMTHRRKEQVDVPRASSDMREARYDKKGRGQDSTHNVNNNDSDDEPETDADHRILSRAGRTAKAEAEDWERSQKGKDSRLRDDTHGGSFQDRKRQEQERRAAALADAQNPADVALSEAPEDVHPGKPYHGEQAQLQAGEKPTEKSGNLWVNHKGVRQKCLLEASQTLFKGHATVFLLDGNGRAYRDNPVAEFLLGAVGDLTVTVSGASMTLQDNKTAALVECRNAIDAEEWADYLCASIMANRPIIRRKPQPNASEPEDAPSSSVLASPRRKGVAVFKTDAAADAALPGAGGGMDMTGGDIGAMDMAELMKVDGFAEMPTEDLSATILEMEAKIASNVQSFDGKMVEKEQEMVRECNLIYTKEKRKAKADVAALNKKLKEQEGVTRSQRKAEQQKLQMWLEHKLLKLDAINKKRLAATEKQFDEFRHNEFDRLNRINNKLKAKTHILKGKQEVFRRMRQLDNDNAPLPKEAEASPNTGDAVVPAEPAVPDKPLSRKERLRVKLAEKKAAAAKEAADIAKDAEYAEEREKQRLLALSASAAKADASPGKGEKEEEVDTGDQGGKHSSHRKKDPSNDPKPVNIPRREALREQLTSRNGPMFNADGTTRVSIVDKPGELAKPDEDFNDLSKNSNIVPSQRLSGESPFKGKGAPGKENGVTFAVDSPLPGERPASPPIPTHAEGGSRFTEFHANGTPKAKDAGGAYGASRWKDDTDDDLNKKGSAGAAAQSIYGGAGEGFGETPAPADNVMNAGRMKQPNARAAAAAAKEAAKKAKAEGAHEGDVPPEEGGEKEGDDGGEPDESAAEGAEGEGVATEAEAKAPTQAARRASMAKATPARAGGRGRGQGRGGAQGKAPVVSAAAISATAKGDAYEEEEPDIGPNPNAKPLHGRGMYKKPAKATGGVSNVVGGGAAPTARNRGHVVDASVVRKATEKHLYGSGRPMSNLKDAVDRRYLLSYDSQMNLVHNREEYLDDMASVLIRFAQNCRARKYANLMMLPLREILHERGLQADKIARAWFCYRSRSRLQSIILQAMTQLKNRAVFTLILYMAVFIGRCRRKRIRRAKLIVYILRRAKQRRDALVHQRKIEGLDLHRHYQVEAPKREELSAVPRGLTEQLQRQAQIEVEQHLRLGGLASMLNGVSKAGKRASRFLGNIMQLDTDKSNNDPNDLLIHVRSAQEQHEDLRSGYKAAYTGSMSINDVRAAHLRANAIASFVKIKNKEKDRILDQYQHVEDSGGFDSGSDLD